MKSVLSHKVNIYPSKEELPSNILAYMFYYSKGIHCELLASAYQIAMEKQEVCT